RRSSSSYNYRRSAPGKDRPLRRAADSYSVALVVRFRSARAHFSSVLALERLSFWNSSADAGSASRFHFPLKAVDRSAGDGSWPALADRTEASPSLRSRGPAPMALRFAHARRLLQLGKQLKGLSQVPAGNPLGLPG